MLKKILRFFTFFLAFLLLLFVSLFTIPTEESEEERAVIFQETMTNLKELNFDYQRDTNKILKIGWAKRNISPTEKSPFAGYGLARSRSAKLHDSLFVRAVAFENGKEKAVVIAFDLMLAPPLVIKKLSEKLPELGLKRENLFFTATHTHHGIGGWADGLVGIFIAGGYEGKITENIVNQTFKAIKEAQKNLQKSTVHFGQADAPEYVSSRLHEDNSLLDTKVRYLIIRQKEGKKACLFSYSAHATCTDGLLEEFGRDYAGEAVDYLEKERTAQKQVFDFAMFSAGTVASHTPKDFGLHNYEWTRHIGQGIAKKIEISGDTNKYSKSNTLFIRQLKIPVGETNLRITPNIKLRNWAFQSLYPCTEIYISILKIGNILWLGMPCDFSGEFMPHLTQLAEKQDTKLIITSFNGAYMGYVTPDKYYHQVHYETMEMNWLGKKGDTFSKMVEAIILSASKDN
ncbi:MAG: hypothetical protein EAZ08_11330 [Cytophagales bacterium]|nr:MAG: hypothetical protein EAZ08_11330 [Cytophagales bacterium]